MKQHINKKNIILLILVTAIVLYITTGGELQDIINILSHVNVFWLGIALSMIVLYWFFSACTLYIMLRAYNDQIKLTEVFKLTLSTQFFNGITPFASGGQPFQIYVLNKHSNMKLSSITSASLHNFIVYQTVLVALGSAAILAKYFFNIFPEDPSGMKFIAVAGFALNLFVIFAIIIIAVSPKLTSMILSLIYKLISISPLKKRLPSIKTKTDHTVKQFHKDILVLMSDREMYFKVLSLNVVKMVCYYAVAYFICLSAGFNAINIWQAIIASAYIMMVTSVVPLPGASGGAEMGFLIFFGSFVIGAQATAIMLLWRFITYYVGLFVGMLTYFIGYHKGVADS